MRNLFLHALLGIFAFLPLSLNARVVIVVSSQAEFDQLTQKLAKALKSDETDICVTLLPGQYIAKENHIRLDGIKAPNTKVRFVGHGAVLVPEGKIYRNGDRYDGVFSPDNSWMCGRTDVTIWSHVRNAEGLIEVVNEKEKLCRLKSREAIPNGSDVSAAYILIPHWYQSGVYKIRKIDNGYIYFVADDLDGGYKNKGYNVNDDYNIAGLMPRYKLCNVETGEDGLKIIDGRVYLPKGITTVREGKTNSFLYISVSTLRSIEFSDIHFRGNRYNKTAAGISFYKVSSEALCFKNCEFKGFQGKVMALYSTPNASIEKCLFEDCYDYGVSSYNDCEQTVVKDNYFYRMGKRMSNSFCVSCHGPNFRVENNIFLDYGFDGIGAGESHKNVSGNKCFGVICNNVLSYSSEYLADKANYTIMDSGAIYLRTKNNGVVIKNNYIHDIDGMFTNQGIYCDNGAFGYQMYGNVIVRIANSNCIGSRRDANGEERNSPGSGIKATNINNIVRDNIVDGRILFVGNERENNGCVFGNNYVLLSSGSDVPVHTIKNVTEEGSIILLDHTGYRRGRIGVSRQSYKTLKKSVEWKWLKKIMISKRG